MTVNDLTAENLRFIEDEIAAGTYSSVEAALNEIIQQARMDHALLLAADEGCRELDERSGHIYDDAALEVRFEELRATIRQRAAVVRDGQ